MPSCGDKIALLFDEFVTLGKLSELERAASDAKVPVIRTFCNIWGVSSYTAEQFYRKGWRDLDDIVEYGWSTLTKSQQIGVKYYEEFLDKIPRSEVESIANTVLEHANRIRDGFQLTIVGGYRRGKVWSGDVDLMLSHPDPDATRLFIKKIARSLEDTNHISELTTCPLRLVQRLDCSMTIMLIMQQRTF